MRAHRRCQIDARRAQRRRQPEERHRREREQQREREHREVESQIERDATTVGGEGNEETTPPARHEQPAGGANEAEDEALGQQLPHEPAPAGAERKPHANLPAARDGAGEEEIGDVRADDQQQQ